jgi:non-specific serine/threonine protein kinase
VLDGESRMVTISGEGGSGKTSVALQVASDLQDHFPDGVWLVELAPLAKAELVHHAVATALSLREHSGQSLVETICRFVSNRNMLLVLDNCEHLVTVCAEFAQKVLRTGSRTRLLTTSREPLRIPGEVAWRLPLLATPDRHTSHEADHLGRYPAVQLFIDRAQAVQPGFELSAANLSTVAAIMGRLEGLPLAIELAAPWVHVLGIEQLHNLLDSTFRSHAGASRTALSRHRTLWATLDWSYELLSEPERALFRRLAVFAGGWTLESAESVCGGGGVGEFSELLGHLKRLVDTSLAQVQDRGGHARYRFLEPVRAYAAERLAASQEAVALRQAHASSFLALAERLNERTWRVPSAPNVRPFEEEQDNFRVALRWFAESGSSEFGMRLAGALDAFWLLRGHFNEGRGWIETFVTAAASTAQPSTLAKALWQMGTLAWYQGDTANAASFHKQALALYRTLPNAESDLARASDSLGLDAWIFGDYASARCCCEEALSLARSTGPVWVEIQALYHLGLIASDQMELDEAKSWLSQSLNLAA